MSHKILMVCLGNICRSPLAEGILRSKISDASQIDSAGTGDWHAGEHPDRRAIRVAQKHGVDISGLRARQIQTGDFDRFDLIFAMDRSNYDKLIGMTPEPEKRAKVRLIMGDSDVPDPYWGDESDFEEVFSLLDSATDRLIEQFGLL